VLELDRRRSSLLQVVAAAGLGGRPRNAEQVYGSCARNQLVRPRSACGHPATGPGQHEAPFEHQHAEMAGDRYTALPLTRVAGMDGRGRSTRARWPPHRWP